MISTDSYLANKNNIKTNNNNNISNNNNNNNNNNSKKKNKKKASCRTVETTASFAVEQSVEEEDKQVEQGVELNEESEVKMDVNDLETTINNKNNRSSGCDDRQQQQHQQHSTTNDSSTTAQLIDDEDEHQKSFLLIDENELMQVDSSDEFAELLGCSPNTLVKVVSIFGSIGHGKSYTLNSTFYGCQEVFQTSSSQNSCTIGIWAAYDEKRRVITIDTEGLLGVSANCQRRTRLLLKVLAISDIVIYRTKSERLEDNLFTFLGDASRVYVQHFFKEMRNAFQRLPELNGHSISELGPVVIIFQETRDTEPLKQEANQTRESIIRSRFKTLGLTTEAFSAIEYVGIQTLVRPTNFDQLKVCIKRHIKNSSSRTPRSISVIYTTLKILNEKFNGDIEKTVPSMFPNQYLTCPTVCLSCNARCTNSMNHHRDGLSHTTDTKCVYQHQFNNHILYCRGCHERGETIIVTPKTCSSNESPWVGLAKYAWAGYVLECPRCGIIHRSRQYWFGNKDTWESSVRTEIKHVWPGELNKMQAAQNAAQRVLDSVNYITETVTSISAKPTKMVSEWVADQIAPNYWIPNSRILHCALCNNEFGQFDQKHHCRLCGNGLCSTCSSKSKPVPERGWGETSVRVCDRCYERSDNLSAISSLPPLPPMLVHQMQQQHIGISSSASSPNGFCYSKNSSFSIPSTSNHNPDNDDCHDYKQTTSSIPIPPTQRASGNSQNTTPTQQFSSSIGSSSSGSNNSNNNNQLINDFHNDHNNSNNTGTPTKQNGSSSLVDGEMILTTNSHPADNNNHSASSQQQMMMDFITDSPPQPIMMINNNYSQQQQQQQQCLATSQNINGNNDPNQSTITARKLGEVLQNTIKTVVSTAIDYPLGVIKDSARPDYWLPDSQITNCGSCKKEFNELVTIHHCRRCGGGFCHECSAKSMPVPERGWGDASVRVCDKCYNLK